MKKEMTMMKRLTGVLLVVAFLMAGAALMQAPAHAASKPVGPAKILAKSKGDTLTVTWKKMAPLKVRVKNYGSKKKQYKKIAVTYTVNVDGKNYDTTATKKTFKKMKKGKHEVKVRGYVTYTYAKKKGKKITKKTVTTTTTWTGPVKIKTFAPANEDKTDDDNGKTPTKKDDVSLTSYGWRTGDGTFTVYGTLKGADTVECFLYKKGGSQVESVSFPLSGTKFEHTFNVTEEGEYYVVFGGKKGNKSDMYTSRVVHIYPEGSVESEVPESEESGK